MNKETGDVSSLEAKEKLIRQRASHNICWLLAFNCYSSAKVFACHLITLESVLSVLLSVATTLYLFFAISESSINGQSLNWVLLSFAVITPLANSISMAFTRRERALTSISLLRSTIMELYFAHSLWDWGKTAETGKNNTAMNPETHSRKVLEVTAAIQTDLIRFLTLPNCARARHRTTSYGRGEAEEIAVVSDAVFERLVCHVRVLCELCEDLKRVGLPGNEASRIRQWEHGVLSEIEKLRMIKRYRTPQGLRSFGRLFSVFLPPFYAPYYSDLARELNSLGMGIVFSILTSIALTSLFETVAALEDPFEKANVLDGIDIEAELNNLTVTLQRQHETIFSEASYTSRA